MTATARSVSAVLIIRGRGRSAAIAVCLFVICFAVSVRSAFAGLRSSRRWRGLLTPAGRICRVRMRARQRIGPARLRLLWGGGGLRCCSLRLQL
jgi:hypothetical protein